MEEENGKADIERLAGCIFFKERAVNGPRIRRFLVDHELLLLHISGNHEVAQWWPRVGSDSLTVRK